MPIICPHTHQSEHVFTEQENIVYQQCSECYGLIQFCQFCSRANRLLAHFCVECGHKLNLPNLIPSQLLRPGEIRQAAQAPSHYSLDGILQLPENYRPFMWFSAAEGLLVLSQNQTSMSLPLLLHFIPAYQLDIYSGAILLSKSISSYATWIQQPLISQQGLFIATQQELHYFPTHGYEQIFAPQIWKPDAGSKIRAIAIGEDGHPLILVSNNHLQLIFADKIVDLENAANDGGYAIAVAKAAPNFCAVYGNNELVLIDLNQENVVKNIQNLSESVQAAPLFHESLKNFSYFEPFLIGTNDSLRAIIPVTTNNSQKPLKAGVVRFDDLNATPTKTNDFPLNTWILPDPWGIGFILWSTEIIEYYEGHQASWHDEGGNFAGVIPLLTPYWFVAQDNGTELLFFSTKKHEDRYSISLECRTQLSIQATKVAGMPPIQSNGRLFIALRENHNETSPVTVYTMQIAN